MGKMKDLAIRIDEIMEKIEEYLSDCDDIKKQYIYKNLSIRLRLREEQLTEQLVDEMIRKDYIKEHKNDK